MKKMNSYKFFQDVHRVKQKQCDLNPKVNNIWKPFCFTSVKVNKIKIP